VSDLTPRTTDSNDLSDDRTPFAELAALVDDGLPARSARPVREGLPPSYRMRADAHYVEQLSAPPPARDQMIDVKSLDSAPLADAAALGPLTESIRRHGVLQPLLIRRVEGRYRVIDGTRRLSAAIAAGLAKVPCLLHEVNDDEAAALASAANARPAQVVREAAASPAWTGDLETELARALGSLSVCTRMLSRQVSSFSRDAASLIIQAEVGRASALLQSARVLKAAAPAPRTRVPARRVAELAMQDVESERLLNNIRLQLDSRAVPEPFVAGDELQLVFAAAAMLRVTFALLEGVAAAAATMAVETDAAGRVAIVVSQDAAVAPDRWTSHALDPDWAGRPGGVLALTALLALRQVANAHHGQLSIDAPGGGTRIGLALPAVR
jgi:ParB-like chromosome segregation protein Spo0J